MGLDEGGFLVHAMNALVLKGLWHDLPGNPENLHLLFENPKPKPYHIGSLMLKYPKGQLNPNS